MVKASAAKKDVENPEAMERKRLKNLAFKKKILSDAPARGFTPLAPSKQVLKHHGKDIIKKSQRKNRFLFSFPGLLAPVAGGKIGELKDLGTKNPILYLDFPQGQMKLFGTIVYPKNRYLSLQFSRGGKNVMCEDNFDNMIVFSDAWWIGTKAENPEEARLDFPKDLAQGQLSEFDFQGGAGSGVLEKRVPVTVTKSLDSLSTEETGDDSSEDTDLKPKLEVTPTRHSGRNAGKKFKFVDTSSEDEKGDAETPDGGEEKKSDSEEEEKQVKSGDSPPAVFDIESENDTDNIQPRRIQSSLAATTESGKISTTAITIPKSKKSLGSAKGSFVQTTISTLFSKVEKKVPKNSEISSSSKGSKQKAKPDSFTKDEQSVQKRVVKGRKSGTRGKNKEDEMEEDIEEFSSSSKATDESDEDWTA